MVGKLGYFNNEDYEMKQETCAVGIASRKDWEDVAMIAAPIEIDLAEAHALPPSFMDNIALLCIFVCV